MGNRQGRARRVDTGRNGRSARQALRGQHSDQRRTGLDLVASLGETKLVSYGLKDGLMTVVPSIVN